MQVYRIVAEKTSVSALCSSPESGLTREKQCILEHSDIERLYCVEISPSHLVTSAQINYYSLVPQLTWDCVVDIEVDPAFLALALASGVFLVNLKNTKNIWKTSDL